MFQTKDVPEDWFSFATKFGNEKAPAPPRVEPRLVDGYQRVIRRYCQ